MAKVQTKCTKSLLRSTSTTRKTPNLKTGDRVEANLAKGWFELHDRSPDLVCTKYARACEWTTERHKESWMYVYAQRWLPVNCRTTCWDLRTADPTISQSLYNWRWSFGRLYRHIYTLTLTHSRSLHTTTTYRATHTNTQHPNQHAESHTSHTSHKCDRILVDGVWCVGVQVRTSVTYCQCNRSRVSICASASGEYCA